MELSYDAFISQLFIKAAQTGTPLAGTFELTPRCTLDCKMCYIHNKANDIAVKEQEKPTEWWLDLAKKAQEKGMLLLLLTGGECMLRKDFEELYLACKKMGFLVSVNTNATLIDEEKIRFFKENPPQRMNITLYGMSRETYGSLCGVPEAFDKVIRAIKYLKEAGVNLKINYTVTPENKDDLLSASDFADEMQIPFQCVTYLFPPLRTCENCGESKFASHIKHSEFKTRLSPEEAAEKSFILQKHRLGDEFDNFLENRGKTQKSSDYFDDCDKEGEKIKCRAGSTTFWVTWDGRMTPCGMMNEPVAEIGNDFEKAWKKIHKEREKIILPAQCKNCQYKQYCDVCAAIAYAETGRFNGVPAYVCEKAKAYTKLAEQAL